MSQPQKYLANGVVVTAVKSEGGGFYDVTIVATGAKIRVLAKVFEKYAKPYKENK